MDTASNTGPGTNGSGTNPGARVRDDAHVQENFGEAKKSAMDAYANLLDAKRKFAEAARSAGMDVKDSAHEQFDEALAELQERGSEYYHRSEDYVKENPLAAAGIAFAAGFLFSRLLR